MKYIVITASLILVGVCSASAGAQELSATQTVIDFYEASQNGDLEKMEPLMGGSFYNRRESLLQQTDSYPEFLKEYYQDVQIEIGKAKTDTARGVAAIEVTITLRDGSTDVTRLIVKELRPGDWRIVGEGR